MHGLAAWLIWERRNGSDEGEQADSAGAGSHGVLRIQVLKQLEALTAVSEKMDNTDDITAPLDGLDLKFAEQVDRLDVVQRNVNLTLKPIGEVQQEQVMAAQEFKSKQLPRASSSAEEGILRKGICIVS
ncbi:hypothetical protein D1007_56361 [Hordeum vulgare]|nr:hypothetical protein D1007_56361 [Hordeum vulgare]